MNTNFIRLRMLAHLEATILRFRTNQDPKKLKNYHKIPYILTCGHFTVEPVFRENVKQAELKLTMTDVPARFDFENAQKIENGIQFEIPAGRTSFEQSLLPDDKQMKRVTPKKVKAVDWYKTAEKQAEELKKSILDTMNLDIVT